MKKRSVILNWCIKNYNLINSKDNTKYNAINNRSAKTSVLNTKLFNYSVFCLKKGTSIGESNLGWKSN